jgi:DNA-binding transcriptional LysR family regulator
MELRHLCDFAAVAGPRNGTEASRRRHVAQPASGQTVLNPEDEPGVKLRSRPRRSVQLSAAGTAFLRGLAEILRRAGASKRMARRAARVGIGRATLGGEEDLFNSMGRGATALGPLPGPLTAFGGERRRA